MDFNQYSNFCISEEDPALLKCFSPTRASFKYLGLLLMCLVGFGSYFCLGNPSALQDKFENDLHMSTSEFSVLYSVYSWPNVILCFLGGFLLDRVFGIKWGAVIYATFVLCGQLVFAMGAFKNIYWLMVLGRFIFGIGADSLTIAQNSYAVLWFKGEALNTLFGLQLSFSKLGSSVNSLTMEPLYRFISKDSNNTVPECIGIVLGIASLTCVGSMACAILLSHMDSRVEKMLERNGDSKQLELVKLSDMKNFKLTFWLSVLICVSYYVAILPFMSLGKLYFMTKYKLESDAANTVMSLVYSISAFAAPVFGFLVDKTGRNMVWVLISIIGTMIAHCLLAFTHISPYICMVLLGISYSSFASSFWPTIALIIPEHQLGTAYGITQALQSLNLAIMTIVCGFLVDSYGYFVLELFFLAWLILSSIPAVFIWISNSRFTSES